MKLTSQLNASYLAGTRFIFAINSRYLPADPILKYLNPYKLSSFHGSCSNGGHVLDFYTVLWLGVPLFWRNLLPASISRCLYVTTGCWSDRVEQQVSITQQSCAVTSLYKGHICFHLITAASTCDNSASLVMKTPISSTTSEIDHTTWCKHKICPKYVLTSCPYHHIPFSDVPF